MNLSFTNQNSDGINRYVSINLESGQCRFPDDREIKLKDFLKDKDFHHPLLAEPKQYSADDRYHYEYHNIDELVRCTIYVYVSLLHAKNPHLCQFKLSPSASFEQSMVTNKHIYFSTHAHDSAEQSLSLIKLEALVSQLSHIPFKFSDTMVIDAEFMMKDLPLSVDADCLYKADETILAILKKSWELSLYELRYIDSSVGFGVFCREDLKVGHVISWYSGRKQIKQPAIPYYMYRYQDDCLSLYTDARLHGNITRFINHAPKENDKTNSHFLEANVKGSNHYVNGIHVVVYTTTKEVLKGEQLLVDYGPDFFAKRPITRFKKNGKAISGNKKLFLNIRQKNLNHLRVMAEHGILSAQRYLCLRTVGISVVICMFMWSIRYFV